VGIGYKEVNDTHFLSFEASGSATVPPC